MIKVSPADPYWRCRLHPPAGKFPLESGFYHGVKRTRYDITGSKTQRHKDTKTKYKYSDTEKKSVADFITGRNVQSARSVKF